VMTLLITLLMLGSAAQVFMLFDLTREARWHRQLRKTSSYAILCYLYWFFCLPVVAILVIQSALYYLSLD
jgi:ABC-type amino acid transport system permease subunit